MNFKKYIKSINLKKNKERKQYKLKLLSKS